jgi:MYXO-CTERM domain-containing protein
MATQRANPVLRRAFGPVVARALGAAALALVAVPAAASNGTKPRIPVDWTGAPCMTIVDRSSQTVVHLPYAVSKDDTDPPLTADEVSDSRTHQFFALCRARDPQTFLPRWITQADIDRAAMVGAAPASIDPEDVFETSTAWADCWFRINADDDRRPITLAAAAEGVDWDTTAVPAGTYTIEGYTWEPPFNIWSGRPGVVKVVDDPDPASIGPAIAIENTEEVLHRNEPVTIHGCVSAMEGSTITAYWALSEPNFAWVPFLEGDPVSGDSYAIDFLPPEELAGEAAMIRVDITDPMGRSYRNYMRELVIVLGTEGPGTCADGGFIGGAGCGSSTGTDGSGGSEGDSTGDDTAGEGGTSSGPAGQDGGVDGGGGGQGCGCQAADPAAPAGAGLLLVGLWGLRRGRRR